jgi:hypothetical protein
MYIYRSNADELLGTADNSVREITSATIDEYAIWRAFNNQYWPAHYEGEYEYSEEILQSPSGDFIKDCIAFVT